MPRASKATKAKEKATTPRITRPEHDAPDAADDASIVASGDGFAPDSPAALHAWLRERLDLEVPTRALMPGHSAPFEYLCHAFFDGRHEARGGAAPATAAGDAVVWANRGGGKTFLAAVATLLDLVFKPTIQVRVLAGSLDQARHMHTHLRGLLEREGFAHLLDGRITETRVRLKNGAACELLAQSQRAVRGTRVQKLRCDEVELFDPDVWEAAQLVTRSKRCGPFWVPGTIECLSTMHVPHGLMWRLVREATSGECSGEAGGGRRRLFKWGVVDVLGACGDERACETCDLREECAGRAKERDAAGEPPGHVPIGDAIVQKSRVSESTWKAEMLSLRPRRGDCVLPEFEAATHVRRGAVTELLDGAAVMWVCGMDFGMRAPTVVLWAGVAPGASGGVVIVVHERCVAGVVLEEHSAAIRTGDGGAALAALDGAGLPAAARPPAWVGIDPAGRNRNDQTGVSNAAAMRASGLVVRDRRVPVAAGLELLRARLRPASGGPRLYVHESCAALIESLERYRYPADRPESTEPVKDGSDHAVDALRYMVQNLDRGVKTARGGY